jgi:tetratricopeptide (TPR) repeat protein
LIKNSFILFFTLLVLTTGCHLRKPNTDKESSAALNKREIKTKELLIKGTTEKVLGNYELAERYFQECIKISPKVATAYFELSEIYQSRKDAQNSLKYGDMAYKLAPDNEWYELNMAYLYMRTGQIALAEKTFISLVKKYPSNVDYLYQLSEIYYFQKKYKDAILIYDKLEINVGVNEELSLHKSKIYLEINQPDNAVLELQKLVKSNPNEMRYLGLLADLYEQLERSDEAFELYNKILELEPNNGYVHLSLADYYNYRGQQDKSFEEMKKAFESSNVEIKLKAEKLEAYYTNSAANEVKKKQGYELLDILIRVHPDNYKGFVFYAEFLARDDRIDEMITMLLKATELNATEFNTWYQLCAVLWEKARFEDLVIQSDKAVDLFPSLPTFYYFSGVGNHQLKKYKEAIESFESGIDYCIDNAELKMEFYQYLGDIYYATNDYGSSDMYYDQALAIDPNNIYVLNNYSYYLAIRNENLEKARTMSEKVNKIVPNNANYLDTFGWVYFKMKDYTKSEEIFKKALEIGGKEDATILEHYGDVLYHLNRKSEALEYWQKAKDKGNDSSTLQKKITTKTYVD